MLYVRKGFTASPSIFYLNKLQTEVSYLEKSIRLDQCSKL